MAQLIAGAQTRRWLVVDGVVVVIVAIAPASQVAVVVVVHFAFVAVVDFGVFARVNRGSTPRPRRRRRRKRFAVRSRLQRSVLKRVVLARSQHHLWFLRFSQRERN